MTDDSETNNTPAPPESILDVIGRNTGAVPKVSLSDSGSEEGASPVSLDPRTDIAFSERDKNHYQVLGEVARGGMGAVLRGHDQDLRRDIAIKVLDDRLADRPEVVQRFVEEAQIGAQLQHPGIVPVYELGLMADERPFFTMKLVKGRTLASLLAARKSPEGDLRHFLSIFEQICMTIAYAHSKGVLHRDLKPANIMIGAFGEVQVVDWGLAKVLNRGGVADELQAMREEHSVIDTVRSGPGSSGSDSIAGSVLGTPAYMAPEQARGELDGLDERADVFALGALLCEILTGKAPYLDDGEEHVVMKAARAQLGPARERLERSGADGELRRLCLDCMAPAAQARLSSAEGVADSVHAFLSSTEERARQAQVEASEARIRAIEENKRRKLTLALAGTVVALLVAVGGGYLWLQEARDARRADARRQVDEMQAKVLELQAEERHDEALQSARAALDLAEREDVDDDLEARVAALVARVEEAAAQARTGRELASKNRELFKRLDQARLLLSQIGLSVSAQDVDRAYGDAFRAYGLDVESEDLIETLRTLRERGLGERLALELDGWASLKATLHGWDSPETASLTALAADLDPDSLRTDVRAAILEQDRDTVFRSQASLDVESVPPATTWVVASAVNGLGGNPIELLERAVRLHPDDTRFRTLLGSAYDVRGNYHAALRQFEVAHALEPDSLFVLERLAEVTQALGHFPTAVDHYRELESRVPDFTSRLASVGFCLQMLGRHEEGNAVYERLRAAGGLDPEAAVHRAAGRYLANLTTADELINEMDAIRAPVIYRLEVLAWALSSHRDPTHRDPERALASADEALSLVRDDWLAWYVSAAANLRSGRYGQALEVLENLQPFHGQRADIAMACAGIRAIAHHHLGQDERALEWADQGLHLYRTIAGNDLDAWKTSPFYDPVREADELVR